MIRKEHVKKIRLLDNSKDEVNLFGQLDVFKKKGIEIEAKASDLALLKGALQGDEGFSPYWTSTAGKDRQDISVLFLKCNIQCVMIWLILENILNK